MNDFTWEGTPVDARKVGSILGNHNSLTQKFPCGQVVWVGME